MRPPCSFDISSRGTQWAKNQLQLANRLHQAFMNIAWVSGFRKVGSALFEFETDSRAHYVVGDHCSLSFDDRSARIDEAVLGGPHSAHR